MKAFTIPTTFQNIVKDYIAEVKCSMDFGTTTYKIFQMKLI
jgi:hypothetical protein